MKTRFTRSCGGETPWSLKYRAHLAYNLSGAKIPFYAEQSGQAELAVDRAPYLAGNTDCGSIPAPPRGFGLQTGVATIPGFSSIAFRHPHGFHGLSVGTRHQVAYGSVAGDEFLINAGQSDGKSCRNPGVRRKSCGRVKICSVDCTRWR